MTETIKEVVAMKVENAADMNSTYCTAYNLFTFAEMSTYASWSTSVFCCSAQRREEKKRELFVIFSFISP